MGSLTIGVKGVALLNGFVGLGGSIWTGYPVGFVHREMKGEGRYGTVLCHDFKAARQDVVYQNTLLHKNGRNSEAFLLG